MADHLDLGEATCAHEKYVLTGTYIRYTPSLTRADPVRGAFSADLVGEAFCTAAADALFDTIQSKSIMA